MAEIEGAHDVARHDRQQFSLGSNFCLLPHSSRKLGLVGGSLSNSLSELHIERAIVGGSRAEKGKLRDDIQGVVFHGYSRRGIGSFGLCLKACRVEKFSVRSST